MMNFMKPGVFYLQKMMNFMKPGSFTFKKIMNFMKMRTSYKKLPLFTKNSILHTYKKLKPQIWALQKTPFLELIETPVLDTGKTNLSTSCEFSNMTESVWRQGCRLRVTALGWHLLHMPWNMIGWKEWQSNMPWNMIRLKKLQSKGQLLVFK